MTTEIVLSDGRFARFRTITVMDMVMAARVDPGISTIVALCARCVTLDDEKVSFENWMKMDYALAVPVFELINKQLASACKNREGIA